MGDDAAGLRRRRLHGLPSTQPRRSTNRSLITSPDQRCGEAAFRGGLFVFRRTALIPQIELKTQSVSDFLNAPLITNRVARR